MATDEILADLRMMTSAQMSILEEVVNGLVSLRGMIGDGLVIAALPETIHDPIVVPVEGITNALDGRLLEMQRMLHEAFAELTKQVARQPVQVGRGGGGGVTNAELRAAPLAVTLPPGGSGLTDTELRATPVPVSGTVSTGGLTDTQLRAAAVQIRDAAENPAAIPAPFTLTAAGAGQVVVAAPGGSSRLRLLRISATHAIRSTVAEPILKLKIGTREVQRGNSLSGRFDFTAASSAEAIVIDIDTLDAGGVVCGTVYYEVV